MRSCCKKEGLGKHFRLPPQSPYTIIFPESSDSHGWHTGFYCVYMVLVVGFAEQGQWAERKKKKKYGKWNRWEDRKNRFTLAGATVYAKVRVGVFAEGTKDSSLCLHGICSTNCLRDNWRYYYAQK